MLAPTTSTANKLLSFISSAGLVLAGSLAIQSAPAQSQPVAPSPPVNPIGPRPTNSGSGAPFPTASFLPAYTTASSLGGFTTNNTPSSFGFYFDSLTTEPLNGLGFASQPGWGSGTSYQVKLWYWNNGGLNPSDYTEIASKTFTHGTSYSFQDGYFWQDVTPTVSLLDTFTSDPSDLEGYVITTIGDFSNSSGNVEFESGTATFNPRFVVSATSASGFNDATDTNGFYPVPVYPGTVGGNGYFNANLSTVPGPLPVLGAAAGFGWTRRLRKRIRASK